MSSRDSVCNIYYSKYCLNAFFFSIDALKIVDVLDNFCKHAIVLWICLFRFSINGWLLHNVDLLTIEQYVLFVFFTDAVDRGR